MTTTTERRYFASRQWTTPLSAGLSPQLLVIPAAPRSNPEAPRAAVSFTMIVAISVAVAVLMFESCVSRSPLPHEHGVLSSDSSEAPVANWRERVGASVAPDDHVGVNRHRALGERETPVRIRPVRRMSITSGTVSNCDITGPSITEDHRARQNVRIFTHTGKAGREDREDDRQQDERAEDRRLQKMVLDEPGEEVVSSGSRRRTAVRKRNRREGMPRIEIGCPLSSGYRCTSTSVPGVECRAEPAPPGWRMSARGGSSAG